MFGKNDVYVVFRVGTKKVKTHHKKNAGKHASFDEILTMNLEDHDLEHGIDVGAYDYDVGSSDDLLGRLLLTLESDDLKRLSMPLDIVDKLRRQSL